jgi:DnaD/phage-associated family protein
MNEGKLTLMPPQALTISTRDLEILLAAGNGDAALLYLHILRSGGVLDGATAATDLHRSDRDIRQMAGRLQEMGLLSAATASGAGQTAPALTKVTGGKTPAAKTPASLSRELPEYQAQDVVRRSMEDPDFQNLVEEVQRLLGRILNSTELKKLFGIYSDLAMPPEVVLLLIQHCREEFGGNVGFRAIEKEANQWFEREVVTYEQAEHWLRQLQERKTVTAQFQRQLHLDNLSPTARNYLTKWMDMGFGLEALVMAGDRTMTKLGRIHWNYMDSIVRSWHEKGLHTVEQIEQGDRRQPKSASYETTAVPNQDDVKNLEQLARLREKMKNS